MPRSDSTETEMHAPPGSSVLTALLAAAVLAGLLGCEAGVDPYVGGAPPYTLWGLMNAGADTQVVRVFTIERRTGLDRAGDIDAQVSSTDLTTGEHREWIHRETTFQDGQVGHVFWAPFRAQHDHEYRLEVARSDGQTSTARVQVPPPVEVEIDTESTRSQIPVLVRGEVGNVLGAEMRYEATNLPPASVFPPGRALYPQVFHPVHVSYDGTGQRVEDGLEFLINLQRDAGIVRSEYERHCLVTDGAPGIALRRVELRFVAASDAWTPPGGRFDPELLVEPGAFSNVENGYGFIGAGKTFRIRWTPVRQVRDFLGYSYDRPCSFMVSDTPACNDPPIPCFEDTYESIWQNFF